MQQLRALPTHLRPRAGRRVEEEAARGLALRLREVLLHQACAVVGARSRLAGVGGERVVADGARRVEHGVERPESSACSSREESVPDAHGETALQHAARNRHGATIEALARLRADLEAVFGDVGPGQDGPRHYAKKAFGPLSHYWHNYAPSQIRELCAPPSVLSIEAVAAPAKKTGTSNRKDTITPSKSAGGLDLAGLQQCTIQISRPGALDSLVDFRIGLQALAYEQNPIVGYFDPLELSLKEFFDEYARTRAHECVRVLLLFSK